MMINPVFINTNYQYNNIGNKISDFEQIKILGRGQFGVVYLMRSKLNNQLYAVKFVEIPRDNDIRIIIMKNINIQKEKIIMENISHPNIVSLYGTFLDNNYFYYISEFVNGTNLEDYVKNYQKNYPNKHIPQDLVISIFKQILLGLKYLHGKYILHRDIKPDNILIDINNKVKITDFGVSAVFKENLGLLQCHFTRVGRPDYACPEILNNQPYDFKCDIFSLGFTIFFVMNYCLPSKTLFDPQTEICKRIPLNIPKNNYYDINLVLLVERMFREKPNERPDTDQALKELEIIENYNNLKYRKDSLSFSENSTNYSQNSINNSNSIIFNNNIIISSMKSILLCLYNIDNMEIMKKIIIIKSGNIMNNFYFPFLFFNITDIIKKKRNNQITNIVYNNNISSFINILNQKESKINGNSPILFYLKIFSLFQKELMPNIWSSSLKSYIYINPTEFPPNRFPQIYNIIEQFKKDHNNPLVDLFYFIILIYERCPNCGNIFRAEAQIASFLKLDNIKPNNNIMNLITNFFGKCNKDYLMKCNCGYYGIRIEEKSFFYSPYYLVLYLEEGGQQVIFNNSIYLGDYIKSSLGPRNYELYAVINKEILNNNFQYIASIKENNNWLFHSGDNFQICGNECLNIGTPSIAIYKRVANN